MRHCAVRWALFDWDGDAGQWIGPAVVVSPERAFWKDRSLVVDVFFARAADDPFRHRHAENAIQIEEGADLFDEFQGVADITVFAVLLLHLRGLAAFRLDNCRDQL